jgi:poly-gamma-glutamate synthesis protein (capsule biosynthesis protein)
LAAAPASAAGYSIDVAEAPEEADIYVSSAIEGQGVPFVTEYWVAAVALPSAARTVSMEKLGTAVAGEAAGLVRVLVPSDAPAPLESWWPGLEPAVTPLPLAEIPAALAADADALALLPLEAVDAGVRTLAIEGTNVVFGTGDLTAYPLVGRAWANWRASGDQERDGVVADTASAVAEGLALQPPSSILLRATGDIIPARCVYETQRNYGDLGRAFRELGPWLAEAAITVGSLDAAMSDAGEPYGCVETFSLLAPAASVEGLEYAGYDVITVATNHVKDCGMAACGDQAFFETLANLRAAGIEPVGGGADLAEARRPAVMEIDGVTFAFLGYDEIASYYHAAPGVPGTAPLTETNVREDVAAAAVQADVVVLLPQWGVEYTADPNENQRALARAAVEAGADLVVGNHPHWVQASEVIDGTFVAYALGNFVFDQDWSLETQQGVVLDAAFHGDTLKGIEYHPVHIYEEHQPRFAEPDEARQILERIWNASAALQ